MVKSKRRPPASKDKSNQANLRRVFPRLRLINDADTRNLLRGILARDTGDEVSIDSISALRRNADIDDLSLAVTLLLGKDGAYPFSNTNRRNRDLLKEHNLTPISAEAELVFVIGHMNGWPAEVAEILGSIATLAELPKADGADALSALKVFAERWGASNLLAKKVAYVMSINPDQDLSHTFDAIADLIDQKMYPAPYFAASEAIDRDISYFSTAYARVQSFKKYVTDDFRKILPLHNIIASPTSRSDIGPFLRKCHSMSLIDEVVGLIQLLRLSDSSDWEHRIIMGTLSPFLRDRFLEFLDVPFDDMSLIGDDPSQADLEYYRYALAFVEHAGPVQYRDYLDRVIGERLLRGYAVSDGEGKFAITAPTRRDLTKNLFGFRKPTDYRSVQNTGEFLRSVLFLRYVGLSDEFSSLTHYDIRYLFEHTMALDILMAPDEMEVLYATVEVESKPIVTILALALHKAQSHDDDIDFKFRQSFCDHIIRHFSGNIVSFIEWLISDTPQIANFMVWVLDRPTLQKMYWIVDSADKADIVRQGILRAVGKQRGAIEYFVEADSIEAQRQVSTLRKYFDDSRIFVDSIAMKRWLLENPSAYAQQYLRLVEHHAEAVAGRAANTNQSQLIQITAAELSAIASYDYILIEAAKIAFEQFCTNTDFGIESYLGRRIRHNTLSGVMRGGVESISEKFQYRPLFIDPDFKEKNERWKSEYRRIIDEMRREYLQFRGSSKPKGLFTSELDFRSEATNMNISLLRAAVINAHGNDLFYELIIRFCWREIDKQLVASAQTITSRLLSMVTDSIENILGDLPGYQGAQYRAELRDAVHDRFARLASWFRQPESGFVSASTRQLGDLVSLEAQEQPVAAPIVWSGVGADIEIDGLSVHRMYDCLSVLIRNAVQYAPDLSAIEINVAVLPSDKTNLARLEVTVSSELPDEARAHHLQRLAVAFNQGGLGASMVREGYSGIKKLRYIVAQSEGKPNAHYRVDEDRCSIAFFLTVELASPHGEKP